MQMRCGWSRREEGDRAGWFRVGDVKFAGATSPVRLFLSPPSPFAQPRVPSAKADV